jgi:hypothetical protein
MRCGLRGTPWDLWGADERAAVGALERAATGDVDVDLGAVADRLRTDLVIEEYEHGSGAVDELLGEVRQAQVTLGEGSAEDALAVVTPLLARTEAAVSGPSFLTAAAAQRRAALEAYCYARVTAILALESVGAREAVPRIRGLAAAARDVAGPGTPGWKVQCAAAEMLSRCGDGEGAAQAIAAAVRQAPDEPYVGQLRASLRSMFPDAIG